MQRVRDQFGQAHRIQQACRNPAGESLAGAGQQGQSGPQGVTGRRVGIARKRVQKEIGYLLTRKMLRGIDSWGEHQAPGSDTARSRLPAQVPDHGFAAIDHHAMPRVHPASDDVLESGMVFNVEPAIYREGWGGIRQCELVAVGPHGAELLTPFQASIEALAPRVAAY